MNSSNRSIYIISGILLVALFLTAGVSCVQQKKTRKKVTVRKCLQCHPEYTQKYTSGNVHDPVRREECFSCHRPHGVYGKIVFRLQQPDICYTCHADVKPAEEARSTHEPLSLINPCSACHNPHNSQYAGLLPADGDESCFTCHERDSFTGAFIHAPVRQGCDTCHVPHSSPHVRLLKQGPDDTCRSCHDVREPGFGRAHFDYPVKSGCVLCHSPHAGAGADLLKPVVHEPVRTGQCGACHQKGETLALKGKADALCLSCHDIDSTTMSVHAPYREGSCTSCHDPHAADFRQLLVTSPETVCLSCHGRDGTVREAGADEKGMDDPENHVKKMSKKPFSSHQPAVEGRCLECHRGHGSGYRATLKSDPLKLCDNCHDTNRYGASGGSHPGDEARACETCHTPHASGLRALLKDGSERTLCNSCHRTTRVELGKFSLHKPFARGRCGDCHQLHRSGVRKGYLVDDFTSGALCGRCHEQVGEGGDRFVEHDPVVKGQCRLCHSPHAADYDKVLKQSEDVLCYSCHQKTAGSVREFSSRHEPLARGRCTSCHAAHGSPYDKILKKNQPVLCLACHEKTAEFWIDGFSHQPAVENCLQCHDAHGADISPLLVDASGTLCLKCHDTKTPAFGKAHRDMDPGPETCVTCHNAHGSPVKSMLYPVMHNPFGEGTCVPCHTGGKE